MTAGRRTLSELADLLGIDCPVRYRDVVLTDVDIDSRVIEPGWLWIAGAGAQTHAASHPVGQAAAVLTDPTGRDLLGQTDIPVLVVDEPRRFAGRIASWIHGEPSEQLRTIGVTGTNGKTTVTHLVEAALIHLGHATGLIGTLGARVRGEQIPMSRTTPEAPTVQRLLAMMRERDCDSVAMEVSSHALALGRVDGITFDVAVFTNLSEDHLDFHGTMENYFQAKASLFTPKRARYAVICVDDSWGERLAAQVRDSLPVLTYGLAEHADLRVWLDAEAAGDVLCLQDRRHGSAGSVMRGRAPLPGLFNAANVAGAVAALQVLGIPAQTSMDALMESPGVPGRMEQVGTSPTVIVDYAHTPDAVTRVLDALRPTADHLICVLGAGGDRDRDKRPHMGHAAALIADEVIVTDDNPRSEDPAQIRAAVLAGTSATSAVVREVPDRAIAIRTAIDAGRGRVGRVVVAILGKGAEQGQEIAGSVTPFDDRTVAREILASMPEIGTT